MHRIWLSATAPGCDGGGDAQDVGPVALDHGLIDLPADQGPRVRRCSRWIERIEPLGRQVADICRRRGAIVMDWGTPFELIVLDATTGGLSLAVLRA